MVQNIDKIIEMMAVTEESRRQKIIIAVQHYAYAMELLLFHHAVEEKEKKLFQDYINIFLSYSWKFLVLM